MKKFTCLVLALVMVLSLCACGSSGGTTAAPDNTPAASAPAATTPATTNPPATEPAPTNPPATEPAPTAPPETKPETPPETEPEEKTYPTYYEMDFSAYDNNNESRVDNRTASGQNGAVVTNNVQASRVGLEILEKGGNAVDAAVAVSFAMGVVEPQASGIGGGTLMLISLDDGTRVFLDGREFAPMAATPDLWPVDESGKVIDNVKTEGGKSVCVPTNVATLYYAFTNYGSGNVTWAEILAPSIELASGGFYVTALFKSWSEGAYTKLNKYNGGEGSKHFFKNSIQSYDIDEIFYNPELAAVLQKIADEGPKGFYEGEIADKIIAAVQESGGVMTKEDLLIAENCQPIKRTPIEGNYKGYTIIAPSPASSGGTHIIEMLNIVEAFCEQFGGIQYFDVNSAEYMHILSEVFQIAFCDRAKFMGDPAFVEGGVPVAGLTSKEYAKARAAEISMEHTGTYEAGDPWAYDSTGYTDGAMEWNGKVIDYKMYQTYNTTGSAVIDVNTPDVYESTETTHVSIGDADGNIVSFTQTINGLFGSGVVPTGLGFPLNNQASDFGIGWGLANSVAGGKKPLSSMSPTLVLDPEGDAFLVVGTPGGTTIFPSVLQCILKAIDYNYTAQEIVNSPRIWDSNAKKTTIECGPGRIAEAEIDKFVALGHEQLTRSANGWSIGSTNVILYGQEGTIYAAADPRRDGKALAY